MSPSAKKGSDTKILRGAEIIRKQIRKQLETDDSFRTNADLVRENLLGGDRRSNGRTCSATIPDDEDDFSDPWADQRKRTPGSKSRRYSRRSPHVVSEDEDSILFAQLEGRSLLDGDTTSSFYSNGGHEVNDTRDGYNFSIVDVIPPTPPPPPPTDGDTPVTHMGRGNNLKAKVVTYLVEPLDDGDYTDFSVGDDYEGDEIGVQEEYDDEGYPYDQDESSSSYLPENLLPECRDEQSRSHKANSPVRTRNGLFAPLTPRRPSHRPLPEANRSDSPRSDTAKALEEIGLVVITSSPAICPKRSEKTVTPSRAAEISTELPSPLTVEYDMLLHDPAYRHAQKAGMLWQSLVGQQVRFPSRWWNGARSPPVGANVNLPWQYLGRYQVQNNRMLNKIVRNRSSAGRLLLHIVVLDLVTRRPVQDVAIGCFHPNARGIRTTNDSDPFQENTRDLWLAVRKHVDAVSVIDSLLSLGESWRLAWKTPLGAKGRVTNQNVRAVYGERPPMETIFVPESELYERLSFLLQESPDLSPPMAILEELVFS